MATVHLALERGVEGFERWVALKRLLAHLGADEEFVRSFVREAQLACRLSHPNIVRIFELGRVGEDYFISMEYIEGRDIRLLLRQARKVAGPPPLQVTFSLLFELLDALDYAHRKTDASGRPLDLVHRDVSPSNLLVTTAGHLKIIDFGIAKANSEKQLTATGKIKGKIAYMAPEALRGRRRDARSDLFSVGVIAHELLTARPLFASKNDYKTIERIQHDDVVPPSAYNTNCPPPVDDFVLRAVAKEPEERFQSARQMLEELEDLAQALHVHATNRDVAGWVEWAFSLPIPKRTSTQDSTVELPGRKASQAEADDELLDIIWGTGGGPKKPLKVAELTALLPADADDLETDPLVPAPTAVLFAIGEDSEHDLDAGWDKALTIGDADRVGARIQSEFESTEPGGLAGRAGRQADDWRTEPSVDSLDFPNAIFSESGIAPLSRPLGGGPALPDVSEPDEEFDDTEPSEIGPPPQPPESPFDGVSEETQIDPDVMASTPRPSVDPEEVILLEPKRKKRKTDQVAIPPLPNVEEPSVSVDRPVPEGEPKTENPEPKTEDRRPKTENRSAPTPTPAPTPAPAPAPAPVSREPWMANRDRHEDQGASRPSSIPPPPPVDSKLPAVLIGLAAAAIIGSVVAFFVWPRAEDGSAAAIPDAAAVTVDARAIEAPPPLDAAPAVDAAPAATARTGAPPRLRARDGEEIPARAAARICIDRRGAVQSVRIFDELSPRVRARVVRAVEKWRYQPHVRDHKPVPACFEETIPIQIER